MKINNILSVIIMILLSIIIAPIIFVIEELLESLELFVGLIFILALALAIGFLWQKPFLLLAVILIGIVILFLKLCLTKRKTVIGSKIK
jgi:hypothetical protein